MNCFDILKNIVINWKLVINLFKKVCVINDFDLLVDGYIFINWMIISLIVNYLVC